MKHLLILLCISLAACNDASTKNEGDAMKRATADSVIVDTNTLKKVE